jgi:hypothetical protein
MDLPAEALKHKKMPAAAIDPERQDNLNPDSPHRLHRFFLS